MWVISGFDLGNIWVKCGWIGKEIRIVPRLCIGLLYVAFKYKVYIYYPITMLTQ